MIMQEGFCINLNIYILIPHTDECGVYVCVYVFSRKYTKITLKNPPSLYAHAAPHIKRWSLFPLPLNLC